MVLLDKAISDVKLGELSLMIVLHEEPAIVVKDLRLNQTNWWELCLGAFQSNRVPQGRPKRSPDGLMAIGVV